MRLSFTVSLYINFLFLVLYLIIAGNFITFPKYIYFLVQQKENMALVTICMINTLHRIGIIKLARL